MKKTRRIKVASYNTYSGSLFVKILANPLAQILIIVGLFFLLQLSGVIRYLQIGLAAR